MSPSPRHSFASPCIFSSRLLLSVFDLVATHAYATLFIANPRTLPRPIGRGQQRQGDQEKEDCYGEQNGMQCSIPRQSKGDETQHICRCALSAHGSEPPGAPARRKAMARLDSQPKERGEHGNHDNDSDPHPLGERGNVCVSPRHGRIAYHFSPLLVAASCSRMRTIMTVTKK